MNDKYNGMISGAFIGDSLALGAHWVYDTSVIDRELGRVSELLPPLAKNFHPNRGAGQHTHYGDQMLLFLEYLKKDGSLEPSVYMDKWTGFYDSYDGYKDHAMQQTRMNLKTRRAPCGSDSTDLSGVFYVPVLSAFLKDTGAYYSNVKAAVRMTHDSDAVLQSAGFLAGLLTAVLSGIEPLESINKSLQDDSVSPTLKSLIKRGLDSKHRDSRAAIAEFGQSCPADYGMPGVIHLIAKYQDDLENGLIENVMAGGDSAARGIFVGSVLGAYQGLDEIPSRWRDSLETFDRLHVAEG